VISIPVPPQLQRLVKDIQYTSEMRLVILRSLLATSVEHAIALRSDYALAEVNTHELPDHFIKTISLEDVSACCTACGRSILDLITKHGICVPYLYDVTETVFLISETEAYNV